MFHTMLCLLAAVAASPAMIPVEGSETVQINFEDPEVQENRSPASLPVEGFVNPEAGVAILFFSTPSGNVQYELENLDDHAYLSGSVVGAGAALIPFSCSSGHWRLTLTFAGGNEFVGEFTI